MQLVDELVEQAVQGLSTLSLETLRWLRSPHIKDIDVRPFSRYQNKQSQLRAARLWARLLCYCLRVVAVEQQTEQRTEQQAEQLESIARLFPWHSLQKRAAERLWKLITSADASSSESTARQRTYVLRLSQALICQQVYHQPFHSSLIHFLAALGVYAETSRLRTAAQFSSTLSSLIYCVRVLSIELCLPASGRAN